jgi:hypothetical protein
MKRWALLIVTLTMISTLVVAQAVITPSGQATTQGAAVPAAPAASTPLVATPLIHLGTPPAANGASNATTGNNAGAVNQTIDMPHPPTEVQIRPEISFGQTAVYVQPATSSNSENENNTAANASQPTGRQAVNLGVSSAGAVPFDDGTNGRSLGDIARANRQRSQNANARSFTNADVARVSGAGGVSGIATSQANSGYPGDNGVINSGAIATSTSTEAGTATPPAINAGSTNVPPANQPAMPVTSQPSNEQQPQQKPSAAPAPHEMSQAQTPSNPADQNAAKTSAPPDQDNEQHTLPKGGSFLPLMAIVGVGATAAGLLSRR